MPLCSRMSWGVGLAAAPQPAGRRTHSGRLARNATFRHARRQWRFAPLSHLPPTVTPNPTAQPTPGPCLSSHRPTPLLQVVPIKKLLLWVEMARQEVPAGQKLPLLRWEQVLRDLS